MFLTIKNIPKVSWSSQETFNLKPKLSTLFFLCFGLILFGFGEALVVISFIGNSPWTVMAQGISINSGLSIGIVTFIVSVAVLSLWFFLKQKPGLGTIFNIVIIVAMLDITIALISTPEKRDVIKKPAPSTIERKFVFIISYFLISELNLHYISEITSF